MKKIVMLTVCVYVLAGASMLWAKEMNIIVIPKGSDHIFWDFIRAGVDQAIEEIGGIKLTWRGPAYNDDTDSQIKLVEAYTKPEVDAIILVPCDKQRLVAPVKKATAQGIKVIVIDSGLDENYHLSFIGTDNYAAGKVAAEQLVSLLNGEGKVMVFRTVKGSASTDQRGDGFVDALKPLAPKIELAADEYGGGSTGKSYHAALKLLKDFPDLKGIFAVNEGATEGMLKALQETGLAGKIEFIGFDSTKMLLDGLAKKEIDGLMIQNPREMGYLGIKTAVAAVQKEAVKPLVYTGAVLATPENYQTPAIKTLLVP